MKNFLILCLQLGFVAFTMATILAIVNYLTGWHLGIKGEAVPADPALAALFFVIALFCGGLFLFMNRKS